jgi:WD40 repeat protein
MSPTSGLEISPLATFTPPSSTRAWQSAPHPTLPLLACASSDKSVRVYSLTSFQLQSTVAGGHSRSIRTVAWKPNVKGESVLATGSFDASAQIWKRYEGVEGIQQIRLQSDHDSADGNDHGEEDEEEWRFAVILEGHDSEIKSVAWSAGGQFLATCSRDKSVWIWEEMDEDSFETVAVLQEHDADVKCVAWHPSEDLLASGSYDDGIRLYREDVDDWACVAALTGHGDTVWSLAWEPKVSVENLKRTAAAVAAAATAGPNSEAKGALLDARDKSGPRLLSCSDDLSIRLWQRRPKKRADMPTGQGRMPSILRTTDIEEDWFEESRLPQAHGRSVYSVSWSAVTGRIVSTGSDGKVVVYEERWKEAGETAPSAGAAAAAAAAAGGVEKQGEGEPEIGPLTEWVVLAELDDAHDVYEINHACWAKRRDRGKRNDDEEIIITTGDDGLVKAWALDEA